MKKTIRKRVLAERDGLSPEERTFKSREIEKRLFSLPEFKSSRTVLFFAAFKSEVETAPMIRSALASGMRVILPKVAGNELSLFEIRDFDKDVSLGSWNIPEPHETTPARITEVDLIVVPGAAFDERGNRIGYGAGFYDKLLASFRGPTAAIAFEVQIVHAVPIDSHDVPVQKIVTEKRVITAQRA